MNTQNEKRRGVWRQGLVVTILALAGAWLAGCSTTVYERGDRAAGSAQAAAMQAPSAAWPKETAPPSRATTG